jgi:hypothetical protein
LRHRRVVDPLPWLAANELEQITSIMQQTGGTRLKPIYEGLDGRIGYEKIRIAAICFENAQAAACDNSTA